VEIDDLYQDIILDHYKRPRRARKLGVDEALIDEENPTCGDHIRLTCRVGAGRVEGLSVDCQGCAICTASASIMAECSEGRTVEEVRTLAQRFTALLRGEGAMTDEELGDLIALRGVAEYPLRIKCATMGWHAIEAALDKLSK
jgi:nitrogen fixation protein NifU and related proteins